MPFKQDGKTALSIAQRLGYISVVETLKIVTETTINTTTTTTTEEKYKVVVPETMHETFMSESEDEGGKFSTLLYQKTDDLLPLGILYSHSSFNDYHYKGVCVAILLS